MRRYGQLGIYESKKNSDASQPHHGRRSGLIMSQLQLPSQWQPVPEWQQQTQPIPQEQQPQQQQPQHYIAAKNPGTAVLLSILFPGAGNFYAGQTG
jgi:hypothetical protein